MQWKLEETTVKTQLETKNKEKPKAEAGNRKLKSKKKYTYKQKTTYEKKSVKSRPKIERFEQAIKMDLIDQIPLANTSTLEDAIECVESPDA